MSQSSEVLTLDDSPVIIGATGMDSVRQCLRTILRTLTYSVPLDEQHMQGIVRPVVRFSLREGVEL